MRYELRRKDFGLFAQAVAGVGVACVIIMLSVGSFSAFDIFGLALGLALVLAVYPYTPLTGNVMFEDEHLVVTITQFKRDRVWNVPFRDVISLQEMKSNGGVTITWRRGDGKGSVVVWPEKPREFVQEVESRRAIAALS